MTVCILVCQCVSGTDSWQRVNTEIPVKSPRFALFDLAEGKSYSFRVRCCNSAGVGEPSDPTEATTVGDKLGQKTHKNMHACIIMAAMSLYRLMTQNMSNVLVHRYPICPRQSYTYQKHRHISRCVLGSVPWCQRVGGLLHRGECCGQQRVGAMQQQACKCYQVKWLQV